MASSCSPKSQLACSWFGPVQWRGRMPQGRPAVPPAGCQRVHFRWACSACLCAGGRTDSRLSVYLPAFRRAVSASWARGSFRCRAQTFPSWCCQWCTRWTCARPPWAQKHSSTLHWDLYQPGATCQGCSSPWSRRSPPRLRTASTRCCAWRPPGCGWRWRSWGSRGLPSLWRTKTLGT